VNTVATNFQPTCHICLANFEHRVSIIRELPCGHILHPECIDEFLTENSSLCPVCKQCMLAPGYCPKITNGMARRERALRKLRGSIDLDDLDEPMEKRTWKTSVMRLLMLSRKPVSSGLPLTSFKKIQGSRVEQRKKSSSSPSDSPEPSPQQSPAALPLNDQPPQTDDSDTPKLTEPTHPRRKKPRPLNKMPTQPEETELQPIPVAGRESPSSFARERMRQIAAKNAPFDDPDNQLPRCKPEPCKINLLLQFASN
jgi:hypothetical protein